MLKLNFSHRSSSAWPVMLIMSEDICNCATNLYFFITDSLLHKSLVAQSRDRFPTCCIKGDLLDFFSFYVQYWSLLYLPPLRFQYVGGWWDRTQDSCHYGIVYWRSNHSAIDLTFRWYHCSILQLPNCLWYCLLFWSMKPSSFKQVTQKSNNHTIGRKAVSSHVISIWLEEQIFLLIDKQAPNLVSEHVAIMICLTYYFHGKKKK